MARKFASDAAMSGNPVAGILKTRSTDSTRRGEQHRQRPSRRLRGIDVARAIAVVGMVMVHFGPTPAPDTALGNLYGLSHGRASVLFVLLAGVGAALLVSDRRDHSGQRSARSPALVRGRLVLRGVMLLPLGLWLEGLDHGALVILQYYAIYFLLLALVLTVPDRWLLVGGAAVLVGGPLVYLWAQSLAPELFVRGETASLDDPIEKIVDDLLLTGAYPLVIWATPLLVGMWIGRRDLAATPVRWWLLIFGLTVAAGSAVAAALATDGLAASSAFGGLSPGEQPGGLASLLTDRPHSQMPLWMLGSVGSACAVLGGMLLLADLLPRVSWPLAAAGQMALTVYVSHLLLLAAYPELLRSTEVPVAFLTVGVFMLLAVAACTLWRGVLPRGPLEAALTAPWWALEYIVQLVRRLSTGRGRLGSRR